MRQPNRPGLKKWLLIAAAAIGLGAGGAALNDSTPLSGPNGPPADDQSGVAAVETIPANSPDIVWMTVQRTPTDLSQEFNNSQLQSQKDLLNFNLQSAASMGSVGTVQDLLDKGADATADNSAALKLALSGAKSAAIALDREHFETIARLLTERGATAGGQQSMAEKTDLISNKTAPAQTSAPPTNPLP